MPRSRLHAPQPPLRAALARPAIAVACAAALLGTVLAGCGSQAQTASNPPAPAAPHASANASGTTSITSTATATGSAPAIATVTATATSSTPYQPSGGTPASSGSSGARSGGSAPAFVEQESDGGALANATAVVRSHGYTPQDTSQYRPGQTLRVLIGTRSGSGGGSDQQAFFFVDGKYIGTDSSQPSASLKLIGQGDTEATLGYQLYKPGASGAAAGEAQVRFVLDNGMLTALDPIPPVESATAPGRR